MRMGVLGGYCEFFGCDRDLHAVMDYAMFEGADRLDVYNNYLVLHIM
jgi:hypothetical protein